MPTPDAGATALYRLYGENDRLLYIGISNHPFDRWRQHWWTEWWPAVRRYTLTWFDRRWDAEAAEGWAIKSERPCCNLKAGYGSGPFDGMTDVHEEGTIEHARPPITKIPGLDFVSPADQAAAADLDRWLQGDE